MTSRIGGGWRRALLFATAQVIILTGVVTATSVRWRERQAARALPPLREHSIVLAPLYDCPWIVSDEQLEATLRKLYPRLRGPRPRMNHVDHAYRIWGSQAVFDDPEALSGEEMRDLLLNHEQFAKVWPHSPGFFYLNDQGRWSIRTQEGVDTAAHTDHTLASVSEVGITRDFPIITSDGPRTFGELMESSLADFSVDQMEYEWSIIAYTLFLPPTTTWVTSEGQHVDFDLLSERLMREMLPNGVCFGHHRLAGLVTMLRVDAEVTPILSPPQREKIMRFLTAVSRQLVKTQHPYGAWDGGWAGATRQPRSDKGAIAGDQLRDQIISTGHILEWLAFAPEQVHPPREVLVRAAQWIVHAIERIDPDEFKENYAYATHGANALALWRKTTPTEFMKSRLDRSKIPTPPGARASSDSVKKS